MTLPNRKTVRADLVTKIKANITNMADVGAVEYTFDHLLKDPQGRDHYCCVDPAGASYDLTGDESIPTTFSFMVGAWAKRDDADGAEDILDDFAQALATMARKVYNARFNAPSTSDYETIDGTPYKFELFYLDIDWN